MLAWVGADPLHTAVSAALGKSYWEMRGGGLLGAVVGGGVLL